MVVREEDWNTGREQGDLIWNLGYISNRNQKCFLFKPLFAHPGNVNLVSLAILFQDQCQWTTNHNNAVNYNLRYFTISCDRRTDLTS
jgi:hypothetical protein